MPQPYWYWSWRPVHVACFLSLSVFCTIPALVIFFTADDLYTLIFHQNKHGPLFGEGSPGPKYLHLALIATGLISLLLAHTFLYFMRRIKMRDLHEYETAPYVPYIYSVVTLFLTMFYASGILGLHMVSTASRGGALVNQLLNLFDIAFIAGPAFTGLIVLVTNFVNLLLRLIFGRELVFEILPSEKPDDGTMNSRNLLSSDDLAPYNDDIETLLKAAQKGDGPMQANLGMRYLEGEDVEKNYTEAYKWLRAAAEQGFTFNLAQMYAGGTGIEKNLVEAYAWLSVEVEDGDKSSAARRDEIAKQMSANDLAKAQSLAKKYIEKTKTK